MKNSSFIQIISACILLVAVIAAYAFWYSLIAAESVNASSLAQQIEVQKQSTSQIAQAKAELSQLSSKESTVDQYFVSTSDVVPFLEQIQSIGKYLGANVQVVSVAANPGTPFGYLTLSLTITGTFDAVSRTIGAIEYEPYDTSITSLTLNTVPSSSGAPITANSSPQWTASAIFSIAAQTSTSTSP
jgi:hypothetical protein